MKTITTKNRWTFNIDEDFKRSECDDLVIYVYTDAEHNNYVKSVFNDLIDIEPMYIYCDIIEEGKEYKVILDEEYLHHQDESYIVSMTLSNIEKVNAYHNGSKDMARFLKNYQELFDTLNDSVLDLYDQGWFNVKNLMKVFNISKDKKEYAKREVHDCCIDIFTSPCYNDGESKEQAEYIKTIIDSYIRELIHLAD